MLQLKFHQPPLPWLKGIISSGSASYNGLMIVQGPLRLVLLPVIYNAMQSKEELRDLPLFTALKAVLRQSTYFPLLQTPSGPCHVDRSSGSVPQPALVKPQPGDTPG